MIEYVTLIKLYMALVTSTFSWTNLFEYSPMGWGLLKLGYVTMISSPWL